MTASLLYPRILSERGIRTDLGAVIEAVPLVETTSLKPRNEPQLAFTGNVSKALAV